MKKWFCFWGYLILISSTLYSQYAVDPHFTELKGMEDSNGNTNLLYRINSKLQDSLSTTEENNIYLMNISDNSDSIFQRDFSYSGYKGTLSRRVTGYDFWENNPNKFIVCGEESATDPVAFIDRFDKKGILTNDTGEISFIGISHQNDSLIYCTLNKKVLFRSTNGGIKWDTVNNNFNVISFSPYNDKIIFSAENGILYKSSDGGINKSPVDTLPSTTNNDILAYDKDSLHIYRISPLEFSGSQLFVSNNLGNANSWQPTHMGFNWPVYLSVDYNNAGTVYFMSSYNNVSFICYTTDFGNSEYCDQTKFDRNIVGFYKKPGTSIIYIATDIGIYEMNDSTTRVIKQFPIEKLKFDPIDVENKWFYTGQLGSYYDGYKKYIFSKEIIKDTILANLQIFKKIKTIYLDSSSNIVSYFYERIDTLNGNAYFWDSNNNVEYMCADLNLKLNETLNTGYRFGYNRMNLPVNLSSINTKNIFYCVKENHDYDINWIGSDWGESYSLTKDFGLTYHYATNHFGWTDIYNLNGAIIKGIHYGDTSFVVGITDKKPAHPQEFSLSQNFPNPFNPSTTINYSLSKAGNTKLTVYNVVGSKVATIVNEYKPAGNYSVQFNGINMASGIYLYRLESGNFSSTKKLILLK